MDSLLQIVLDVFHGSTSTPSNSALSSVYKQPDAFGGRSSGSNPYDAIMEDPSLANQMLFELSESEDEV